MAVTVRIPLVLVGLTNGESEIEVHASGMRELVDNLETAFPGMKARLCHESGELRNMLNFFVNDKDIRFMEEGDTRLQDGDRVTILPLIAGG